MEVQITLTPIRPSESSEVRRCSLNKEKQELAVGRASRNPEKGNCPSSDNTIFKCPIMSRLHARFTASPSQRQLYLSDLGSTHGTFIGSRRVGEGSETAVANGDIVTFGTKVVNGLSVYQAKAFKVEYSWHPRPTLNTQKNVPADAKTDTVIVEGRVFRVPDSDNEEEVIWIRSSDPSVQVLDSKVRTTTYCIPSNSDNGSDLDELEEEKNGAETWVSGHDSAITTPEQPTSWISDEISKGLRQEEPQKQHIELKPKGPKLQEVSSNVNGEGSSQTDPINLDKDPTHLPEHPLLPLKDQLKALEEQQIKWNARLAENESDDEGPEVLPIQPKPKRSDIADLLNDKPMTARATLGQSTDKDKAMTKGEGKTDQGAAEDQFEGEVNDNQNTGLEKSQKQVQLDVTDLSRSPTSCLTDATSDSNENEDEISGEGFPIDFDEANHFDGQSVFPIHDHESNDLGTYYAQGFEFEHYPRLQRASSPSDAALARASGNLGPASRRSIVHTPATFPRLTEPPTKTWHIGHALNDFDQLQNSPLLSSTDRHYRTGPFSFDKNICNAPPALDTTTHANNLSPAYKRTVYPTSMEKRQSPSAEVHTQGNSEEPNSKLHISNLINPYSPEPSRSTKRKAAAISEANEAADSLFFEISQESQKQDAQPREICTTTEMGASLDEMTEQTSSAKPATTSIAIELTPVNEPARKKAKTSSTSGMNFLLGVGVGLVGAVGAVAAFIASIPDEVKEEVRLSLL